MKLAQDRPPSVPTPWATDSPPDEVNAIPVAKPQPGYASLQDGFPSECFAPVADGGLPPRGADFNGALQLTTAWARWVQAGGAASYDADFAAAVDGYPKGALLLAADGTNLWLNLTDANATDPDGVGASGWMLLVPLGVPAGGDTAYVLTKNSPVDGDYSWRKSAGAGGTPGRLVQAWTSGLGPYTIPHAPLADTDQVFSGSLFLPPDGTFYTIAGDQITFTDLVDPSLSDGFTLNYGY